MTSTYFNDPAARADRYPHQQYADAVEAAFKAAGVEPVEYYTHDTEQGLGISYLWRPHAALPALAEDVYLGHGVMLLWTAQEGWGYNPLDAESDPAWDGEEPVPVARIAAPEDLVDFARLLLAGDPDSASASQREWQHADALRGALADHQRAAR